MDSPLVNEKVVLFDHAFTTKAQTDPAFRQALVLDPDAALNYYRISPRMEKKMRGALRVLDRLMLILADDWTEHHSLRQVLGDNQARRLLMFAPREAASVFKLAPGAIEELMMISAFANTIFEALLGEWRT
jgi:hypothetical protein